MNKEILNQIKAIIKKGSVGEQVNLAPLTTIKIGGPAEVLVETPSLSEIQSLFSLIKKENINFFLLGGGSNVIFSSRGFSGVVIKYTNKTWEIFPQGKTAILKSSAGVSNHFLIQKLIEQGWSGLEYLFGMPGTVGGAVWQNSKWPKDKFQISDIVQNVSFLNIDGTTKIYQQEECVFSAGSSIFQSLPGLIYEVELKLKKSEPQLILQKAQEVMAYRQKTQPIGAFSAGCAFKNISAAKKNRLNLASLSAGYLIEGAGLKSFSLGGFIVSPVHANFLVNTGKASSDDYLAIIKLIKSKVKEKFGVELEEEVRVIS